MSDTCRGDNKERDPAFLLADNLDQHHLFFHTVEFAVKDLLPWTEIQLPFGNRGYDLPAHDLALHVRVGILFSPVVPVLVYGFMRGKLFQPYIKIMVQSGFIVIGVDVAAWGDIKSTHCF